MKKLNYIFIGWCKEGQHDKIWGAIELVTPKDRWATGKYLTFWGRRGKRCQTKIVASAAPTPLGYYQSEISKKIDEKKYKKGYETVDRTRLYNVYPDFEKDLQTTAFWSVMTKSNDLTGDEFDKIWADLNAPDES